MLNISENSVSKYITPKKYQTLVEVEDKKSSRVLRKILYTFLVILLIVLFLPWTQNIRSGGQVTTLKPNQKPQNINSVIGGRIENWYVQEGDFVQAGDTILKVSDTKDKFFDNQLLDRTENQIDFKKESVISYEGKIGTLDQQLAILKNQRELKLSQARVKLNQAKLYVQNDSLNFIAKQVDLSAAKDRFSRMKELYDKGLKSLTDLETRRIKLQEAEAKQTEAQNKWLNSQNDVVNAQLEISNIQADYDQKYNKTLSSKFSTMTDKLDTETNLSKLENEYSNYTKRSDLYYILAPQDGYITQTFNGGIGEVIKEGQEILTLMPKNYDLAVELYIEPIDLPLIKKQEEVLIQFDGWPAIIFSGWPNSSHGTFRGKIYAVDQFIGSNGKYRVLVAPDQDDEPWPEALRYGGGTNSIVLLDDVPIWYELWRQINGFPPNYYSDNEKPSKEKK